MPPKDKAKKGAISGNYKAGKPLKDIMPAGSKPPREGVVPKLEGEPEIERKFDYEPLAPFPEWPGNEEAKNHDFSAGCEKTEEGEIVPFTDDTEIFLPPSFKEFVRDKSNWLRPGEYIREVLAEQELERRKAERKKQQRTRKNIRKQNMLNMGAEDMTKAEEELLAQKIDLNVDKTAIEISEVVISHLERLETEAEIAHRKAEEEKKAEANKAAKKKPAAGKKDAAPDPLDEPQLLRIPIENSLDLGFSMPAYTKWVTSQFQLAKDRYIRDVDSNEKIWERIYPQENGMPIVSPSGKYWVKLRFMGKERLIEIDDRIPCDFRAMPILPRTSNLMELWPQLLTKALLKVYSYKWYQSDAQFDQEIGDGSIIHSLTGLIPEHIVIRDFENEAMPLFRNMLTDDQYFGHKAYLTAYCQEDFRPKLPSQQDKNKAMDQIDEDGLSELSVATSQRMLGKLKQAASMAISVTTGKKLSIKKNANASNIIPGFGYALMDIFENDFVDMDSIVKAKDQIEEVKSPFKSPKKSMSPSKLMASQDGSMSKEEARRMRREERKAILEEFERKEREAPKQYSLLQIKTAVTRYPTINYVQPFTNEEIMQGKKCLLNHMRRTEEAEKARQAQIEISSAKKRRVTSKSRFTLNVRETNVTAQGDSEQINLSKLENENAMNAVAAANGEEAQPEEDQKVEELKPRQRALGGVWIETSDFPHAFQHVIVFHNMNRFENREVFEDAWLDGSQPFINNEKDVYLKLELDEEAFRKFKEDNNLDPNATLADLQRDQASEEKKGEGCLPGEMSRNLWGPDQVLLSYTPNPTKGPSQTMPRYFMRFASTDFPESVPGIDESFTRYHEGKNLRLCPEQSDLSTIWLKPNMMAPMGYTLWVGSSMRKISVVSQQDYLASQKSYVSKQYTCDFVPLQKGKNHIFGKWDFKVQSEETSINLRVSCPTDKYLIDYMRLKIIDKGQKMHQDVAPMTLHSCNLDNLVLPPTEDGYILIIEGCMPYNTADGQLQIDMNTNQDNLELHEIIGCEPVEYSDAYSPSKYGIIFKEKVFISPVEATSTSINIRLQKDGQDLGELGLAKLFHLDILDNGQVIYSKEGCNQITLSHFMFRSNQGLVDGPPPEDEPDKEIKHNYVIQAVFLLHLWPECKAVNEQTEGLTWTVKMFNSETLALVKDTDKEDREKALKASWESADPGRAEKAAKSRQRYLLLKKQKAGEELTEEELEVLKEKRERIRKKDLEELANAKGGNKKAPAKPDPKKAAKGAPVAEKTDEEEESKKRVLPEPTSHVNQSIVTFLRHFKSDRLITVTCENQNTNGRKRTDEEKEQMRTENEAKREEERATHEQQMTHSAEMVQKREAFRSAIFERVSTGRNDYKEQLSQRMDQRNAYRELIANRLEKQKALTELLAAEKIDIAALEAAIEAAVENLVKQSVIDRANKQLEWLKYCKDVEAQLQQAVQEKVKENLLAVLEKIEKEGIIIEPKALNDAKNILNKLK